MGTASIISAPKRKEIVHTDRVVVYFCNAAGKIILAPDTRITPAQCGLGPDWKRHEAIGAKEIEKVSLAISKQLWEEKKARTVVQHLREKVFIDQLKVRCRLRIAQSYSKNDESINRQIYSKIEERENQLYRLIFSEFDPSSRNTALDIELSEESLSPLRNVGKKRQGIE